MPTPDVNLSYLLFLNTAFVKLFAEDINLILINLNVIFKMLIKTLSYQ